MTGPVVSCAREIWWHHRWGLMLTLAIPIVHHILRMHGIHVLEILEYVGLVYLLSIFSRAGIGGNPRHAFVLPARTVTLVGVPMLLGLTTIAIYVALWEGSWTRTWTWRLFICSTSLAATALLQAFSWTLITRPAPRFIAAVMVLPVLTLLLVMLAFHLEDHYAESYSRERIVYGMNALCMCIIAIAFAAAVFGVGRLRHGEPLLSVPRGFRPRLELLFPERARTRLFGSPMQAQVWFECREKLYLLPLVPLAMMGVLTLFSHYVAHQVFGTDDMARLLIAFTTLPLALSLPVGYASGKCSLWANDLRLSSFQARLPVSDNVLVWARNLMALRSVILTALLLALVPAWLYLIGAGVSLASVADFLSRGLTRAECAWYLLIFTVGWCGAAWCGMMGGQSLALSGRTWLVNTCVVVGLVVVLSLSWTYEEIRSAPEGPHPWILPLKVAVIVAMALKLIAILVAVIHAVRARLFLTTVGIATAWYVSVCCLILVGRIYWAPANDHRIFALGAVIVPIPLALPLAGSLLLFANRHHAS